MFFQGPEKQKEMAARTQIYISEKVMMKARYFSSIYSGQEVCGLLIGSQVRSFHISRLVMSPNKAINVEQEFLIAPRLQFRLNRILRERRDRILGVFHTHPAGLPYPSATDILMGAGDGLLWLIGDHNCRSVRLYQIEKNHNILEYEYDIKI